MDTQQIDRVLIMAQRLDKRVISEFCKPAVVSLKNMSCEFTPEVTAFKIGPSVIQMLPRFMELQSSTIFHKMWHDFCNALDRKCTCLDDVVKFVWTDVEKWYAVWFILMSYFQPK